MFLTSLTSPPDQADYNSSILYYGVGSLVAVSMSSLYSGYTVVVVADCHTPLVALGSSHHISPLITDEMKENFMISQYFRYFPI